MIAALIVTVLLPMWYVALHGEPPSEEVAIDREAHEADIEAAVDDDHHAVRRNAAISLFKLRGEAMERRLLDLSRDDSERVREWAAHMLGGVDSTSRCAARRPTPGCWRR